MLLSVIIPVYNVENTLERCVESVLSQHVDDMEVILVDDGSTDSSPKIVDGYAQKRLVRAVHQQNKGLSEARNTGIGISKGRYITFVDSDDFLEPGTYPRLLGTLQEHPEIDILEYSVVREKKNGVENIIFPDKGYTDMRYYWITGRGYSHTYAWNKIYSRGLFETVRFEPGKKFEDVRAMSKLLTKARRVFTTSCGLYHYTYNPVGITVQADGKAWRDLLEAHLDIIKDKQLQSYPGFEDYYYQVLNIQLSTFQLTGDEVDIRLRRLPFHGNWKLMLLQTVGMKGLCRLNRLAHRLVDP